jgi:rubredoxin---NAD+ reductase
MSTQEAWREYLCKACGYVYNERDGDVDSGLAPGTRFEDIPEDWYCPICGVSKADFVLVEGGQSAASRASSPLPIRVSTATHSFHRSSARKFDVVIVGGGTAAWKAAESLRSLSSEISIALISQCEADRYDKPLLSVAMHRQFHLQDLIKETGDEAAQRLNVFLFAKTIAISLEPSRHIVRTTVGSVHYKHLIIAHGAKSVLPGHLPAEYCWRINHLSQYVQFRESLGTGSRRVLVIGAGLIGSELANDLALGGHSVTLTDLAARPLERLLSDAKRSEALLKAWENLPIEFIGNTEVLAIKKNQTGGYDVSTSLGRNLSADAIIVATGLRTCDRLAASANLAYNGGIVVDPVSLSTSAPDIYALGDCVTINGEIGRYIEPIGRQARTIASQIVGDTLIPYVNQRIPIRIKTSSMPMTVND